MKLSAARNGLATLAGNSLAAAASRCAHLASVASIAGCSLSMPGKSHSGELPPRSATELQVATGLETHVRRLAERIGPRSLLYDYDALRQAASYIENQLSGLGYSVGSQPFEVRGKTVRNLEVNLRGRDEPDEIYVVGAHYDSVETCPGANDNGSGVAALLELARLLRDRPLARTVRLVAFPNEEPPHFRSDEMGSVRHARRCRERGERILGMLSLETLGYYTDVPGSQRYPFPLSWFYPDTGNFIAFVANIGSRSFVRRCAELFRQQTAFPSEGASLPSALEGVGWSDHRSFWQEGYDAVMVTDTAPFRYPYYHDPDDIPEHLDFERTARVVVGLQRLIEALAND